MTTTTPAGQIDDELRALSDKAFPGRLETGYRGIIVSVSTGLGVAKVTEHQNDEHIAHRDFIIALWNAYRSGHLSAARGVTVTEEIRQAAKFVELNASRHAGTYESSPFEFFPAGPVRALLAALASPSAQQGAKAPVTPQPPSGDGVELRTTATERKALRRMAGLDADMALGCRLCDDVDTLLAENARLRAKTEEACKRTIAAETREAILREDLLDARAALDARAGESADGWQPIDTAPKDGRMILVAMKSGNVALARWSNYFECLLVDTGFLTMSAVWWYAIPTPPSPLAGEA